MHVTEKSYRAFAASPDSGLTIREYFVAMAMQGLLANAYGAMTENNERSFSPKRISELAVLHADATIEAINQSEREQ